MELDDFKSKGEWPRDRPPRWPCSDTTVDRVGAIHRLAHFLLQTRKLWTLYTVSREGTSWLEDVLIRMEHGTADTREIPMWEEISRRNWRTHQLLYIRWCPCLARASLFRHCQKKYWRPDRQSGMCLITRRYFKPRGYLFHISFSHIFVTYLSRIPFSHAFLTSLLTYHSSHIFHHVPIERHSAIYSFVRVFQFWAFSHQQVYKASLV